MSQKTTANAKLISRVSNAATETTPMSWARSTY